MPCRSLDPENHYTIPYLILQLMLCLIKLTGIEIDLVSNQETYAMIEAGLRGGMTQTTCKQVEANDKYMGDGYDSSKESSYIYFYLDAG